MHPRPIIATLSLISSKLVVTGTSSSKTKTSNFAFSSGKNERKNRLPATMIS